MITDQLILLDT